MTQGEMNQILRDRLAGDGAWFHVDIAVHGDGTVTLYINGEEVER